MRKWLQNKTIVLTGASSGIGKELSKILIKKYNATVIGIGRSQEKMHALTNELAEYSDRFIFRVFDISSQEAWNAFAQDLKISKTSVDLLINNAGIFPSFQTAENTSMETLEKVLKVNFWGSVYAVNTLLPLIPANKHSGIVNICSSGALCTIIGTSAYSASKSALKSYSEALLLEERNRHVGIIYPGTTKTDLFRDEPQTNNSALDKIAMQPQKMAKKIARVIYKRKKRAILGWDAKLMNFISKIAPVKGPKLIAFVMKKSKSKVFKNVFNNAE